MISLPTQPKSPNHDQPCPDLIMLKEKVNNLINDVRINTAEIRPLIELAAQIKLLMSLSIGGGTLAIGGAIGLRKRLNEKPPAFKDTVSELKKDIASLQPPP